ncbi:MAG: hypothetical protein JWP27_3046 [Flaviaesturariibacter sp.]|nr:hypothetical protein [Flaviaesturariibacter sp.]
MSVLHKHENISYANGCGNFERNILLTPEGVLVVDLRGAITRTTITGVMRQLRESHAREPAKSFCVLADKALLVLGSRSLDVAGPGEALRLSGTLVVNEAAYPAVDVYAQRMARYGVLRVAFTSRVEGLAWATRQALMVTAQELWEKARREKAWRSAVQYAP